MKRSKLTPWRRIGLYCLAGAAALGALIWAFMPRPVTVETAVVSRGGFVKTVDEDGKTRARERYVVSAPIPGRLLRVALKAGAPVEKGRLLAVIVPSAPGLLDVRTERELSARLGTAQAERRRAEAAVERARVALEQARADLEHARQLAEKGFIPPTQVERDERDVQGKSKELNAEQFALHAAGHQVEQARAALLRLKQEAEGKVSEQRFEIHSPVAGQVLRVIQESEAVVAVGQPILEIADPTELEVVIDVLTADAGEIRAGAPVRLDRGEGEAPLEGKVRLVEPAAFTKISALGVEEQRVNVVVDFVSPIDLWRNLGDAHRIDARITMLSRDDAIKVPVSALFRQQEQWAVFAVVDGRARARPIRITARNSREAMVEDGLAPGDRVIVYPGDRVHEGVRVDARAGDRDAPRAASGQDR